MVLMLFIDGGDFPNHNTFLVSTQIHSIGFISKILINSKKDFDVNMSNIVIIAYKSWIEWGDVT